MTGKKCTLCLIQKPSTEFDGKNRRCNECKSKKDPEALFQDRGNKLWIVG